MENIKFIKADTIDEISSYLVRVLDAHLEKGQRVLWLVAGGSALPIAAKVAAQLQNNGNLGQLSVTLTDERYGPKGHPDSNWKQLLDQDFNLPGAKFLPVLTSSDLESTAESYSELLNKELSEVDYSVALAGMGPDGHIFGIKPHSPAVASQKDVEAYDWDDYKRLTPTARLIRRLDEVVVYAVGQEKYAQFDNLDKDIPADEQPAQLLKQLPKVTIFNDYKGDSV